MFESLNTSKLAFTSSPTLLPRIPSCPFARDQNPLPHIDRSLREFTLPNPNHSLELQGFVHPDGTTPCPGAVTRSGRPLLSWPSSPSRLTITGLGHTRRPPLMGFAHDPYSSPLTGKPAPGDLHLPFTCSLEFQRTDDTADSLSTVNSLHGVPDRFTNTLPPPHYTKH